MVSTITVVVVAVVAGIIVIPAAIWLFMWWTSFTHKVWIAKQSGRDESDVIWVEDKCKVKDEKGQHVITFRGHKGASPSFPGEFWTKVFKLKAAKVTDEDWPFVRKNIGRGLYLYQTTEGEFHPMRIVSEGTRKGFKVLSQDNRGFVIRSLSDNNELTLSGRRQMFIYLAVAGVFIVLVVAFIMWLVYITETATNLCGVAGSNVLETLQGTVGG